MWTKILLLFFVFSFLFRADNSFDQDLGRHIKLGEIILQTHQVPKTNLFSYTNPSFPFINTHWLFEVFVHVWSKILGLQSLLILKIIIFLFSVWLILKLIPKENRVLMLPIGFIFLHVLRERLELRPEIFSFLFAAATYFILEMSLRAKRSNLLFILPIIQLIWINTHIYFFVGLLIQAIFIVHTLGAKLIHLPGELHWHLGKRLILVFILSILLSLLNPHGLTGFLYPLNVNANYGYTIVENQTMNLLESINFRDPNFLFVKIAIILVILSVAKNIIISFTRLWRVQDDKEGAVKNILLAVSGLALALLNVRSFPYLVFLSLPSTLINFGPIKRNALTGFLFLVFSFMLILESFFYLNGDYYRFKDEDKQVGLGMRQSVKGAMDFVLAHKLAGPIYNNFDIGSYIIYRGYPKYSVFVDGRPEAYPTKFFQDIYIPTQYDYNKFKDLEKQFNFKTIIFSHTDQTPWGRAFLQNVVKDESWKIVYIDDFMLVLVNKEAANEQGLPIIDLAKLNPNSYHFGKSLSYLKLGLFLLGTKNIESGRQFIEKTLQLFPNDPIANSLIDQSPKNNFFW